MFLASLLAFSHTHCIAICAALVPLNLLTTLYLLVLVGRDRPRAHIHWVLFGASVCAALLVAHVLSWLLVGVVMAPTYILLALGLTCWSIHVWAGLAPSQMQRVLQDGWGRSRRVAAQLWFALQ